MSEGFEVVDGFQRFLALQALGRDTARVEIRAMSDREATVHTLVEDVYHGRRTFWERALLVDKIRDLVAAERGVPASELKNRDLLAYLGMSRGRRPLHSLVSECLGALGRLTPGVLDLAEVKRDDPRLAKAVTRPVYRQIRDAPDDRARAAIVYRTVHGHPPVWAPTAEVGTFDIASVISTRRTPISVAVEIAWARVPPEHSRTVRRRARAELDRLLREPPVRLSLPTLSARAGEPRPQPDEAPNL